MSDFDEFYVLEFNGPKGWEIQWTGTDPNDCVDWFWRNVQENEYQMRITSPKPSAPANVINIADWKRKKSSNDENHWEPAS
jgi:hypothetical protein